MSLDKFGRYRGKRAPARGRPGIGFVLTNNGNFNIQNKRLTNVALPNDPAHVATKIYVDKLHIENLRGLKDVNLNVKGLIDASLIKRIESLEHNLTNYMRSVDASREDFEKFRQITDQNTVNSGKALTELALKVDNLEK